MTLFWIVRGRSIDGTVYYNRGSWTCNIEEAQHLMKHEAEGIIANRRRMKFADDPDDAIGKLGIIELHG